MDAFFKGLRLSQKNPDLYEGLGDCYRQSQAYEMAVQQYDEALKLKKNNNLF